MKKIHLVIGSVVAASLLTTGCSESEKETTKKEPQKVQTQKKEVKKEVVKKNEPQKEEIKPEKLTLKDGCPTGYVKEETEKEQYGTLNQSVACVDKTKKYNNTLVFTQKELDAEMGRLKSEREYVLLKDNKGRWQNNKSVEKNYHQNGKLSSHREYEQKLNKKGSWDTSLKVFSKSYHKNGKLSSDDQYVIKQNDDGSWKSLSANSKYFNKDGSLSSETKYEQKLHKKWDYFSVYSNGKKYEKVAEVLQNKDGSWTACTKSSVEKGFQRTAYECKQDQKGVWHGYLSVKAYINKDGSDRDIEKYTIVKQGRNFVSLKTSREYSNGAKTRSAVYKYEIKTDDTGKKKSHQVSMIEKEKGKKTVEELYELKKNEEGVWKSFLVKKSRWNTSGKLRSEDKYKLIQKDNGNWTTQKLS